jgi:pimeloyl-ACP methyl ester carboxylesterase
MTIARINGTELFYEVTGTGPRLVLVHGSWGDATNWDAVVPALAERYEVVTYDRRGHTRSADPGIQGSRVEDAADLAGLIEHLGGPAHVIGNSFGAAITITLVATRPDLVASAAAHEPPLFGLLQSTDDPEVAAALEAMSRDIAAVLGLLVRGDELAGTRLFMERIAFGPGSWDAFPPGVQAKFLGNAGTFLDESRDLEADWIDVSTLATNSVPVLLSRGTESPRPFGAIVDLLATRRAARRGQRSPLSPVGHSRSARS